MLFLVDARGHFLLKVTTDRVLHEDDGSCVPVSVCPSTEQHLCPITDYQVAEALFLFLYSALDVRWSRLCS